MNKDTEIRWYSINGVPTMYYRKPCIECGRIFHTRTYHQKYCTGKCKANAQSSHDERVKRRILDEFIAENGYYSPEKEADKKPRPVHISASAVVWR